MSLLETALNLPSAKDLLGRLDALEATVNDTHAKILEIHAVFQGLATMLPGIGGPMPGAGFPPGFDPATLLGPSA